MTPFGYGISGAMLRFGYHVHRSYAPHGRGDFIKEELQHGVANFDYGVIHPHVFDSKVEVVIYYCDSSSNYMIQALSLIHI